MDTLEEFENATFAGQRVGDMTTAELKHALWWMSQVHSKNLEDHKATLDVWARCQHVRNPVISGVVA